MFEFHLGTYELLMTINLTVILVVMLAACLCCRKKVRKDELVGLEGMVKLKNPDKVVINVPESESQAELNASMADSEKRASTAAFRSLPDIPVNESNDNNSELYETVADKLLANGTNTTKGSPTPSQKKLASVSQHSSISQADDVSSPYSRVKNMPHDYAKVRIAEHPYAQLNAPSTSSAATLLSVAPVNSCQNSSNGVDTQLRGSQISEGSSENLNEAPQVEIPAASAIAGMISASQDLPYMTPPIISQHFSGDSQDSSKGYTSISVREPLANILSQQPPKHIRRNPPISRDVNDSHYATVSDDSDETYAAIDDPNNRNQLVPTDIYTSGSETYAQIQPLQSSSIVVAVEINNCNSQSVSNVAPSSTNNSQKRASSGASAAADNLPVPTTVDNLRTQMHSRQPSSSSNISTIVCNLGSPKPEKRQANSPLPPTPKYNPNQAQLHQANSNSNLASVHNSVTSVVGENTINASDGQPVESVSQSSPQKNQIKSTSPSKNIEGMYAKVIKKHKLVKNLPISHGNSPIMERKHEPESHQHSIDGIAVELPDAQKLNSTNSIEENRTRRKSYSAKDHGYETIPGDKHRKANSVSSSGADNRKSDCYATILQKERLKEASKILATEAKPPNRILSNENEEHYETLQKPNENTNASNNSNDPGYEKLKEHKTNDPNYEQLKQQPSNSNDPGYEKVKESTTESDQLIICEDADSTYEALGSCAQSDDGYAKVLEKTELDATDGYSKIRGDAGSAGYETIAGAAANHNYASILETKQSAENESDHYARISETVEQRLTTHTEQVLCTPPIALSMNCLSVMSSSSTSSSSMLYNSSTITTATTSLTTKNSGSTLSLYQYGSLSGSETDPNYESVRYAAAKCTESSYEKLQSETANTSSTPTQRDCNAAAVVIASVIADEKTLSTNDNDNVVDDYVQV